MAAWRLHRGILPDDVLAGHFEHFQVLKQALQKFGGCELAPGLALLYMDASFLNVIQQQGVAEALVSLELNTTKEIIRRQSNLFKPGATSEEVVSCQ